MRIVSEDTCLGSPCVGTKMQEIAEFHKVSFAQFVQDSRLCGFIDNFTPVDIVKSVWQSIKLPVRATSGSGGYDFFLPYPFCLRENGTVTVPTGIRAEIHPGWTLILLPRSGLASKYGLTLVNTAGVIDSDYFFAENEGHIQAKLTVKTNMSLGDGDRFIQGIFMPFGITYNDKATSVRTGGFGSTGVT